MVCPYYKQFLLNPTKLHSKLLKVCLSPVMQAYGLTETTSSALSQLPNQTDTNTVGSVIPCSEIRLVDWCEGGYRCTDKPNPRGEIYIGGDNVAVGYYKQPELTEAEFKVINGVRYFASGDIGEMLANGNLKIIDRKKDLVKLSGGEYVSLNKVESILKLVPFIENCCVYANPLKSYCIALVCPNHKCAKLYEYLSGGDETRRDELKRRISSQMSRETKIDELVTMLNEHPEVVGQLNEELAVQCRLNGFNRFEIPVKFTFVREIWTPDTGLVTDSLKLKRRELERFYMNDIVDLYARCQA